MSGILPRYEHGPVPFEVSASAVLTGGQMVESDGSGKVQAASANSILCVGVTVIDGAGASASQTVSVGGTSEPTVNAALLYPDYVSVAAIGVYPVQYAASAVFGQRMKCAASGQVTPFTGGETPGELVGICYEPAGVTVSSGYVVGAMRLAGLG